MGLWAWVGVLFLFFSVTGIFPKGEPRPIAPSSLVAQDWPVVALGVFAGLVALGWLVTRPRLAPTGPVFEPTSSEVTSRRCSGSASSRSLSQRRTPSRSSSSSPPCTPGCGFPRLGTRPPAALGVYAIGFVGPLLLLGSFAFRYEFGFDALWYLVALTSVGFVPVALVFSLLAWGAAAAQVGAVAARRYAPYPSADERPRRGPIRESIRQTVLLTRRLRAPAETPDDAESAEGD